MLDHEIRVINLLKEKPIENYYFYKKKKERKKKMTVLQRFMNEVRQGKSFKVDFLSNDLIVNGKYLIHNGVSKFNDPLYVPLSNNFWADMEQLYKKYKYSRPTAKTNKNRRKYFKALFRRIR